MKEKAKQLYIQEHPNEQSAPSLKELRRQGYLQKAKTLALREIQLERGKMKRTQEEPLSL